MILANKENAAIVINSFDQDAKVNALITDKMTYFKLAIRFNSVNCITSDINKYVRHFFRTAKLHNIVIIF